jgi:hypothetical protein
MHIWLDNRLNANTEGGRKVFWSLPLELIKERLKLGVCGGEAYSGFELDPREQVGNSRRSPRDVDVRITHGLGKGEALRHHPDDGVILVI